MSTSYDPEVFDRLVVKKRLDQRTENLKISFWFPFGTTNEEFSEYLNRFYRLNTSSNVLVVDSGNRIAFAGYQADLLEFLRGSTKRQKGEPPRPKQNYEVLKQMRQSLKQKMRQKLRA